MYLGQKVLCIKALLGILSTEIDYIATGSIILQEHVALK